MLGEFIRKHVKLIDAILQINEHEHELRRLKATIDGDSSWMMRREKYCEKCDEICEDENDD